jgi:hypothetical protein
MKIIIEFYAFKIRTVGFDFIAEVLSYKDIDA